MENQIKLKAILPLFFISGIAGLMYELSWIRESSLVFGATLPALTTVTALFFGGMALGNWKLSRPTVRYSGRLLGKIELAIAISSLLSILLFSLFRHITPSVYPALQHSETLLNLYRILAVAITIGIPTFCIGATFPVMMAIAPADQGREGSVAGLINGINALGAVTGTILAGFALIPLIGMTGTVVVAAICNLIVAVAFLRSSLGAGEPTVETSSMATKLFPALPLFFALGFCGMAAQVLWSRFLSLIIHNTVYTYTLTIAVVILGIAAGSIIAGKLTAKERDFNKLFGFIVLINVTTLMFALFLPAQLWLSIGTLKFVPIRLLLIAILMFIPALFSGAAFPVALKMVGGGTELRGRVAGMLNATNTIGGILGSLIAGFVLLPYLGIGGTALLAIAILYAAALTAILQSKLQRSTIWFLIVPVILFAFLFRTPQKFIRDFLVKQGDKVVSIKEGTHSAVVVKSNEQFKTMEIDRLWQGESRKTRQIMAAHIPMLLADSVEKALVIGVGPGVTAERFTFYGVDSIDLVDIEPEVFRAAENHFRGGWMNRPWIRRIATDGRSFVMNGNRTYDLISVEIGQVFRPHAAGFYSEDFYRCASARLSEKGIIGQFVPVASFDSETFRRVIASFIKVFPNAQLWYNRSEFILVGFKGKPTNLIRPSVIKMLAETNPVSEDLAYNYWGGDLFNLNRIENLAGSFLLGPDQLQKLAGTAKPYRDAIPELEYASAASEENPPFVNELIPFLSPMEQMIPGAPMRELRSADQIRRANLDNIFADELMLAYQRTGVVELLLKALEYNSKNISVHRMLGEFYWKTEQFDQAEKHLMRAYGQDPSSFDAGYQIAMIRIKKNEMQKAIDLLVEMLNIAPNDAKVHALMAGVMTQVGNFEPARRHVLRALEIDSTNVEAKRNLEYLNAQQSLPVLPQSATPALPEAQ